MCKGHPTGICDSSRSPSPFCSITVPSIGTSIEVLRLTRGRLQCHVSADSNPRFASSVKAGKSVWSRRGSASSLIISLRPCMGSGGPCAEPDAGPLEAAVSEEFGVPECTNTVEAAGLEGSHRWGIILPNSSRVSLLTYKAIVAVRYPELVLHDQDPIQIGHFVSHDHTVEHGGFRTVLWDAPKDLRTAVEDVVAFLTYLQKRHRDLRRSHSSVVSVVQPHSYTQPASSARFSNSMAR